MTLNCIKWIFSDYGVSPSLALLPGSLWSRVVVPVVSVPSMNQIGLFAIFLLDKIMYEKQTLRNNYTKSVNMNI